MMGKIYFAEIYEAIDIVNYSTKDLTLALYYVTL